MDLSPPDAAGGLASGMPHPEAVEPVADWVADATDHENILYENAAGVAVQAVATEFEGADVIDAYSDPTKVGKFTKTRGMGKTIISVQ